MTVITLVTLCWMLLFLICVVWLLLCFCLLLFDWWCMFWRGWLLICYFTDWMRYRFAVLVGYLLVVLCSEHCLYYWLREYVFCLFNSVVILILFLWWWKRLFWVCVIFYDLLLCWCGLVFVLWFVFGFSCFVLVYRLFVYCGLVLLVLVCDLVWFSYLFGWCIYVVFDLCGLNGFWLILMSFCDLGFVFDIGVC